MFSLTKMKRLYIEMSREISGFGRMSENRRNSLSKNWNASIWTRKVSELQVLSCSFILISFLFSPLLSLFFLLSANRVVCQLAAGHKFLVFKIPPLFSPQLSQQNFEANLKKKPKNQNKNHPKCLLDLLLWNLQGQSCLQSHDFSNLILLFKPILSNIRYIIKDWQSRNHVAYSNPGSLALRQTLSQWPS